MIIIGAGAAGLAAAQVLSGRGRRLVILEARNRLGGRILTHRERSAGMPIELGAEFVHGRPEVTWRLLREAGLAAVDLPFNHRVRRHGKLVELPDTDSELHEVFSGLAHLGRRDMSFGEYLRRHAGKASKDALRFAISFVEGFDAADPERISAQSLAEEQKGIGNVDDETQFRLVNGYGALVEHLHRSLDPKGVKFCLQQRVEEIRWRRGAVEASASGAGGKKVYRAARAIITLPLGILQLGPESKGAVRFSPDIAEKRKAAMGLVSGPIVKAVLQFREPFWEDKAVIKAARAGKELSEMVFLHAGESPFPTWWTLRPMRLPVLIAWAGGPRAVALAGKSRAQLRERALRSLADLFPISAKKLGAMLSGFDCHDWVSDEFSRGAYSYVAVGGMNARKKLSEPVANTLFFAGEAVDTSGQASTVAGALASGQRAALQVLGRKK